MKYSREIIKLNCANSGDDDEFNEWEARKLKSSLLMRIDEKYAALCIAVSCESEKHKQKSWEIQHIILINLFSQLSSVQFTVVLSSGKVAPIQRLFAQHKSQVKNMRSQVRCEEGRWKLCGRVEEVSKLRVFHV